MHRQESAVSISKFIYKKRHFQTFSWKHLLWYSEVINYFLRCWLFSYQICLRFSDYVSHLMFRLNAACMSGISDVVEYHHILNEFGSSLCIERKSHWDDLWRRSFHVWWLGIYGITSCWVSRWLILILIHMGLVNWMWCSCLLLFFNNSW